MPSSAHSFITFPYQTSVVKTLVCAPAATGLKNYQNENEEAKAGVVNIFIATQDSPVFFLGSASALPTSLRPYHAAKHDQTTATSLAVGNSKEHKSIWSR